MGIFDGILRRNSKKTVQKITVSKTNDPALQHIIRKLQDHNFMVRNDAALSLGEMRDEQAIDPLIAALESEYKRLASAAAMGDYVPPLAWEPPNPYGEARHVLITIANVLGRIGDARAVSPLKKVLKHAGRDQYIKDYVGPALRDVKGRLKNKKQEWRR